MPTEMRHTAEGAARGARRADAVIDALVAAGVHHVVVCPGSRSTPLILALARRDLRPTVCVDERVGAFVALGHAKVGTPCAIVVTSGSAVANLLPALTEARRDGLAVVAVCADRSLADVARGASQTVPQGPLLAGACGTVCDIASDADADHTRAMVAAALGAVADPARRGPVMLNVRFDKPLEPPEGYSADQPHARARPAGAGLSRRPASPLRLRGARGLAVVGALPVEARQGAARALRQLGWPVVACVSAGLASRDLPGLPLLTPDALSDVVDAAAPDGVVWLGGLTVLEELPRALARVSARVTQLAPHEALLRDPLGVMADARVVDLDELAFDAAPSHLFDLAVALYAAEARFARALDDEIAGGDGDLDEVACARAVVHSVAPGGLLFVGNSMPARDVDRFGGAHAGEAVVVMSRGVAGIDGNVATTLGMSLARVAPATALIGDVAALHDLGGLCAAALAGADVRVVVVNNDGGGIFQELPIAARATDAARDTFERCFLTPHGRCLSDIAQALGLRATRAATLGALRDALRAPVRGAELIELHVDMAESSQRRRVHRAERAACRAAVVRGLS